MGVKFEKDALLEIANMILKASMAKDSFDNVSCIVIAVNLDGITI